MGKRKDRCESAQRYAAIARTAAQPVTATDEDFDSHADTPLTDDLLTASKELSTLVYANGRRTLPRMKKFRFQLLHQWMTAHLAPCRVADVGGGKGLLSYLLQGSGWSATVIDPFAQALPAKYKDLSSNQQVHIPTGAQVNTAIPGGSQQDAGVPGSNCVSPVTKLFASGCYNRQQPPPNPSKEETSMQTAVDVATPAWEEKLRKFTIVLARLGLAYLFLTQLFWKLPPTFGCTNDFAFPVAAPAPNYWDGNGSGGLCYWMGLESIYAPSYRQVLVTDMRPAGLPKIGINIAPLAQANALLLDNVIIPNIAIFGWLIWLAEFWIFLSMLLGFLSRFGALVAIGITAQLWVGLANIPRPYEWEWAYGAIVLLSIVMLGLAPGRVFGIDSALRRRLAASAAQGNRLSQLLMALS